MKNLRNLRNKPFLVVDVIYRPARFAKTERKGWGDSSDAWDVQEHPRLVNRIDNKTMDTATLIIDVNERVAIKNRFAGHGNTTEEEVVEHFLKTYSSYLPVLKTPDTLAIKEAIETTNEEIT